MTPRLRDFVRIRRRPVITPEWMSLLRLAWRCHFAERFGFDCQNKLRNYIDRHKRNLSYGTQINDFFLMKEFLSGFGALSVFYLLRFAQDFVLISNFCDIACAILKLRVAKQLAMLEQSTVCFQRSSRISIRCITQYIKSAILHFTMYSGDILRYVDETWNGSKI